MVEVRTAEDVLLTTVHVPNNMTLPNFCRVIESTLCIGPPYLRLIYGDAKVISMWNSGTQSWKQVDSLSHCGTHKCARVIECDTLPLELAF